MPGEFERPCKTTYDPVKKIWSGFKYTPTYGPDYSIGRAVLEAMLRNPEHIYQICHHNGKIYTHQDIANLSIRVAQHFQKLNIQQCEMISIVAGNTDYLVPLAFGALLCGLTICPLDPLHDKEIIKSSLEKLRPTFVFTTGSAYKKIKECLIDLDMNTRIYTLTDHIRGVPEITEFLYETGTEKDFVPVTLQNGSNQIAVILRSSGTTGVPKAICLTHAMLLNVHRIKAKSEGTRPVFLRNTTIYWISGLNRLIDTCLQGITSVINEEGFKASMIPAILEKYKITLIYSIPTLLIDILGLPNVDKIDFSSIRQFISGGAHIPYSLIEKAKKYMPKTEFHVLYGSSETCGLITTASCNPEHHVGQVVPNFDIKVVDDQDVNLGPGQVGEICARSIFPWPGYYKSPDLTSATYRDGWIYSGDTGYINDEGNLFILDRKKDILQYFDHCIYPSELEKIISEIPGVADVCVCGLPDEKAGQLLTALIIKSEGSNLTAKEVSDYVAERVEDFKKLRGGVYFYDFIPKTLTGKNLRHRSTNICEWFYNSDTNGTK